MFNSFINMKSIKPVLVILMFFLTVISLMGCVEVDFIYVDVVVSENSPVVFRLGGDDKFSTPAKVREIEVSSRWEMNKISKSFWHIKAIDPPPPPAYQRTAYILLSEVTYGVVPDGFRELTKAIPLEQGVKYDVIFEGPGYAECYFTNKPGGPIVRFTPETEYLFRRTR